MKQNLHGNWDHPLDGIKIGTAHCCSRLGGDESGFCDRFLQASTSGSLAEEDPDEYCENFCICDYFFSISPSPCAPSSMYVDHAGNPGDHDHGVGVDGDDSGIVECVLS